MKRKDALWVMQMCRDRDARSEAEREAFDTAIEALKSESIFSADRPKGKWVGVRRKGEGEWIGVKCSICGAERAWYGDAPNFCPDCGANMREERSE